MPMTFLALLLLSQSAPQEPPVTTGSDRGSAVRLQVTGHLDLHYVYRSEQVDAAGSFLNFGVPVAFGSPGFLAGRSGVGAGVEGQEFVSRVIEVVNQRVENGGDH